MAHLPSGSLPLRTRARLPARIRIGAAAVAGDEDVRVGRALWSGRHLDRVHIAYPPEWAAHRASKREDLVERVVYDLWGPPPRTPEEVIIRPDYLTTYNHVYTRLEDPCPSSAGSGQSLWVLTQRLGNGHQ